ncbi:MAG: hypothetical protein OEZ43_11035 [Gammaproteobacteria bacterium]|nr:hypothetical protein [Gammaproteobacteria bacterium]
MTRFFQYALLIALFCAQPIYADELSDTRRDYRLSIAPTLQDSRIAASGGIFLHKFAYDVYWDGFVDTLPEPVQPWFGGVWNFFWTFNFSMWPHDMGHWVRANQAGGDFVIDEYRFPFPLARMVQAPDAPPAQQTLMSAGGFEINTLMRWQHERLYFETGYRDDVDMIHSFIQTMFFPIYTLLIAPNDPESRDMWEETYGDPADYTKLLFQHYANRPRVRADGSVDPTITRLYREIFWTNLATILVDPMTYKSFEGMVVDLKQPSRIGNPWLVTRGDFSWAYTTRFNPGAIGYEVYLTQHLKWRQHYAAFYMKMGRPFKNRGIGLYVPRIVDVNKLSIGGSVDAWDQDVFGKGIMLTLSPTYHVNSRFDISADLHWKDTGYIVGRRLDREFGLLVNGTFYW